MKKLYVFIGLVLTYSLLAIAMNNKFSKEKLEGKWNVKVADAPYGYQDYVLDIKEEKGDYKVDILFVSSNSRIANRPLTLKDGKLVGNINVDGEAIAITIWEDKGVVQGTAKSYEIGTITMSFTRPKD